MPKIERYFTEGREGVDNFLADVQNLNSEWAHMNEDGTWQIDFGIGNDQEIADALGIDVEAVQAIMRKMKDSDKVLDLQDKLTDLAEKRLEIIEKEYNYIEDIQTSLQDRLEADRDLLKSLGTAINNSLNVESLNESVKAQEEIYNQLTKKLADYQAEVDSQLKSGLMKQGSEQWYDAMKNINDFTANIAKASSELIELSDKLREIKYDTLQYIIDGFSRSTDKLSAYIDLLDSRDEKVPEELYQQQIDNNNASIQKQYALREEKLKEQGLYDVGSERYQDLAEDISKADEEILKLRKDKDCSKISRTCNVTNDDGFVYKCNAKASFE